MFCRCLVLTYCMLVLCYRPTHTLCDVRYGDSVCCRAMLGTETANAAEQTGDRAHRFASIYGGLDPIHGGAAPICGCITLSMGAFRGSVWLLP
eukprot:3940680-Rhodomonas_salina.3